jgi:hypothetical protein
MILTIQVAHSQCSLRENPKLLQNFRPENNTIRDTFLLICVFNVYHFNSGLVFKNKNYSITSQNCVYFKRENFQNLRQKR